MTPSDFANWVQSEECIKTERFIVIDGAHRTTIGKEEGFANGFYHICNHIMPPVLRDAVATSSNAIAGSINTVTLFDTLVIQ